MPLSTTFSSSTTLTVQITASELNTQGTGYISVVEPNGNVSNTFAFMVTAPAVRSLQTITFGTLAIRFLVRLLFRSQRGRGSGLGVTFTSNTPVGMLRCFRGEHNAGGFGHLLDHYPQPGNTAYAAAEPVTVTFTILPAFADLSDQTANEKAAIELLASYAITSGCTSVPFDYCPDLQIPRNQMAVFIIRSIYGTNNFSYTTTPYFTDVPANAQFFKYIQKMKDLGITNGETATLYGPNDIVTRGQMAVFIIRARDMGTGVPFTYSDHTLFHGCSGRMRSSSNTSRRSRRMLALPAAISADASMVPNERGDPRPNGALRDARRATIFCCLKTTPVISAVSPATASAGKTLTKHWR